MSELTLLQRIDAQVRRERMLQAALAIPEQHIVLGVRNPFSEIPPAYYAAHRGDSSKNLNNTLFWPDGGALLRRYYSSIGEEFGRQSMPCLHGSFANMQDLKDLARFLDVLPMSFVPYIPDNVVYGTHYGFTELFSGLTNSHAALPPFTECLAWIIAGNLGLALESRDAESISKAMSRYNEYLKVFENVA